MINDYLIFVTMGHGLQSTPEIYSGGHDYLISAGGVQRGKASQLVAHPTVLFLPDKVMHLDSCFYLPGNGEMKNWNNTGVCDYFACGPQPVHIHDMYKKGAYWEHEYGCNPKHIGGNGKSYSRSWIVFSLYSNYV